MSLNLTTIYSERERNCGVNPVTRSLAGEKEKPELGGGGGGPASGGGLVLGPGCCYLEPILSAETEKEQQGEPCAHGPGWKGCEPECVGSGAPAATLPAHGHLQPLWGGKRQI